MPASLGHRRLRHKPGIRERLRSRRAAVLDARKHPRDEVPQTWGGGKGRVAPIHALALQLSLDLLHLRGAHPVLPGLVVENGVAEGEPPCDQLVSDDAHGKDVGGGRVPALVGLGCDVLVSAEDVPRLGRLGRPLLHRVEVDELDRAREGGARVHARRASPRGGRNRAPARWFGRAKAGGLCRLQARRARQGGRSPLQHHVLKLEVLVYAAA
mmetsp:Transcript_53972/g.167269  ORF Transcript_53972/g.167269 Transcript_53972/m.167269 type:complete len:212 (+) Transcript_53972:390-1025(+)